MYMYVVLDGHIASTLLIQQHNGRESVEVIASQAKTIYVHRSSWKTPVALVRF
jgi:hypothetical protein